MKYDAIVVGGGIAGLTSAAFLSKSGCNVLLCEKEDHLGGLVGSFDHNGFTFDSGIRALENSGILMPMLKQLELEIDFLPNPVSLGIETDIVDLSRGDSIKAYQAMLNRQFPDEAPAIAALIELMEKTMDYLQILYGIDNPLFMDLKHDREYLWKTLVPWMFKYITTVGKIKPLNIPVETHLKTFIADQVMIDVIAQHFFKDTPAFFALSYFSLYLDYQYPSGGTGTVIKKMREFIELHGGTIQTNTFIQSVNPGEKFITDGDGNDIHYEELIWAADLKSLYSRISHIEMLPVKVSKSIYDRSRVLSDKSGGDSVLSLYLTVDLDKAYFKEINTAHFFYTPYKKGLSSLPLELIKNQDGSYTKDQSAVFDWISRFFESTTFEISIPVLRDEMLAPPGKTGLIISTLFDYSFVKHLEQNGWYDEFKLLCKDVITKVLTETVYPKLADHIIDGFVSTPLTIAKRTGNKDGAITGWAFTNDPVPCVSSMPQIAKSIKTSIPHVIQAGQWTYSPSGFPISILTGKMAADQVAKKLKP